MGRQEYIARSVVRALTNGSGLEKQSQNALAWILSLFMPDVAVYAVPNDGGWYDFGFFLGVCVFGVGSQRGAKTVYRDRVVRK